MFCPQCGTRTKVYETRGRYRGRRCLEATCGYDFTTCESIVAQPPDQRLRAKTMALRSSVVRHTPARRARPTV